MGLTVANINVSVGTNDVNISIQGGVASGSVASDSNLSLSGVGGTTYIKYNSTTGKMEFWVEGVKKLDL